MSRKILVSSAVYLAVSVLQSLVQLLLLPLYTHLLSPSEYGVIATVIASSTLANVMLTVGLHGAAQRFCADHDDHTTLFSSVLLAAVLISISLGISFLILLHALPFPLLVNLANWPFLGYAVVHSMAMGVMLVGGELFRMRQEPLRFAAVFLSLYFAQLTLNVIFIKGMGWQLSGALLAHSLAPWCGCLMLLWQARRFLSWAIDVALIKQLANYAFKVLPDYIFGVLITVADRLLLMQLLGPADTGFYSAGAMIATFMPMLVTAISYASRPVIYQKFADNSVDDHDFVRTLTLAAMLGVGVLGANVALWSPQMLQVITTPVYYGAWGITALLLMRHMLYGMVSFLITSVLYNKQKVQFLFLNSGGALIVLITSSLLLAPKFGVWGMAIAMLASSACYLLQSYYLAMRAFSMHWPLLQMLSIMMSSFAPALLLAWFLSQYDFGLVLTFSYKALYSLLSLFLAWRQLKQWYPTMSWRFAFNR